MENLRGIVTTCYAPHAAWPREDHTCQLGIYVVTCNLKGMAQMNRQTNLSTICHTSNEKKYEIASDDIKIWSSVVGSSCGSEAAVASIDA